MRYSIGEFSELIGLTPDTLRLYEKYHIVNPVKDPNNGYRYYDDLDVRNLLACRRFRSFDFPLEIAAELTVSPNIGRLDEALKLNYRILSLKLSASSVLKLKYIKQSILLNWRINKYRTNTFLQLLKLNYKAFID